MNFSTLVFVGLSIYILAMVGITYWGRNKAGSIREFTIADADVGGIVAGFSVFATSFSASTYLGTPALFFDFGWPAFTEAIIAITVFPLSLLLIGRRLRNQAERLDAYTLPDFIGARFQSRAVIVILSVAVIALYISVMIANIKAGGLIFERALNLSYNQGVFLIVAISVLYVIFGGMWASIITDNIQAVGMALVVVVVLPVALIEVGGISNMTSQLSEIEPSLVQFTGTSLYNVPSAISQAPFFFLYLLSYPYIVNRILTLESTDELRNFIIMYWIGTTLAEGFMIAGGAAKVLNPDLMAADASILFLITELLPSSVAAFLFIAILTAAMSSIDSILHAGGTTVGNDLYRRVIAPLQNKDPNSAQVDRYSTLLSKGAVVLFAIVPIYFAIFRTPDLLSLLLYWTSGVVLSIMAFPLLFGLFWERTTTNSVIVGMLSGGLGYILLSQFSALSTFINGTIGGVISATFIILISLVENEYASSPSIPENAITAIDNAEVGTSDD